MSRKSVLMAVALVVAFAMGFALAGRMQSGSGEVIARDVIAGGGSASTAPSGHVLHATIGQPVVGISQNASSMILVHGFHTMAGRGMTAARRWELY